MSARVAGWSLIGAAIGFTAVFAYLAQSFGYPQVLDGTAADVLPLWLVVYGSVLLRLAREPRDAG